MSFKNNQKQFVSTYFVLGGARSGKSLLAEQVAADSGLPVFYIATAEAGDDEMASRIEHHKQQRPDDWQVIESPFLLTQTLSQILEDHTEQPVAILVDCLTLWITNWLVQKGEQTWFEAKDEFIEFLTEFSKANSRHKLILVSNEVGYGIVPMGELSRQFVDESGRLHQVVAQVVDKVDFVMAGLPLTLKGSN